MTTSSKRSRAWIFGGLAVTVAAVGASACEGDDSDVSNGGNDGGIDALVFVASDARTAQDVTVIDANTEASTCASGSCVVALAVDGDESCALMGDTTIRCWGDDSSGQLGFDPPDAGPAAFAKIPNPTAVANVSGAVSFAVGGSFNGVGDGFACAQLVDAGALCWGGNASGQLGRGSTSAPTSNAAPVLLTNPIAQISATSSTACAVDRNGDVSCWGSNGLNAIDPTFTSSFPAPTSIAIAAKFKQVSVGSDICALATDNHVWCWGRPIDGSLGRAITDGGAQDFVPAQVQGLDDVIQVAAGGPGACALTSDGVVHCWGGGQPTAGTSLLGRGAVDSGAFDPVPAPVVMPTGVTFTQIAAHQSGFCALASDETVWCWGNNFYSSAGVAYSDGGGVYPVWIPTKIPSLAHVTQIASGAFSMHVCALDRSGVVSCWGYNYFDQLGTPFVDASTYTSLTPLVVAFP